MQQHYLVVSRTAHYYSLGEPGPHIRQLWFVCHGYAQLADSFLRDFDLLDNGHTWVIAPEGLNHFYKKGFAGDVGANWMTKHFRDGAIQDNAIYLQTLYNQCIAQVPPETRIVLLGFSQGTATICRWILRNQPHFHDLVLWAGLPPEDLDYSAHREYLKDKNLFLLYGSSDPFLTPDRIEQVHEIEGRNGVDFEETRFAGGHEIPDAALRDLLKKLN